MKTVCNRDGFVSAGQGSGSSFALDAGARDPTASTPDVEESME